MHATRKRLKDLSDEAFAQVYGCDRFTATVLTNRYRYIVSHMSNQFRWHAFSPIIRDSADLCGMFSGPPSLGYPMAAVSETMPLFFGSIPDAIRIVLEEYGPERLRPGDTLIVNDCYRVGTHFNDACCIRPVFHRGELVGAVCIRAHLVDVGGTVFGGFSVTTRNTYQNGLRIPPTLLYSEGKPVASTFTLIYDNTRLPSLVIPDLQTEYKALEMAEQLLNETIDRYGYDAYVGAIRFACDASDEAMRQALTGVPDGVYRGEETFVTDGLPDSPAYTVKVGITKRGDRAEVDLRGSSPATRGSINCTWLDIKTAVVMALKLLIDRRSPMTSGTLRGIDIVVPPDALFNASPPTACQFYNDVVMAIVHAIFRALNPVLGEGSVSAAASSVALMVDSVSASAEEYPEVASSLTVVASPWGATREGDGDSGQQPVYTNLSVTGGVEAVEAMFPNGLILDLEYQTDTGGPGLNRGGAATLRDVIARTGLRLVPLTDLPAGGGGSYGGRPGAMSAFGFLGEDDPERASCAFHPQLPGSVSRFSTSGGGGWGDPYAREPDRVKRDVRDGYVSIEGAARDYGVVVEGDPALHPERLTVDVDATARLRSQPRPEPGDGGRPGAGSPQPRAEGNPDEPRLEPIEGSCPECQADDLRRYPVLAAEGWFDVVKCQVCLNVVSRTPWNRLGWVSLEEDWLCQLI